MRTLLFIFIVFVLSINCGHAQPKPLNDSTWQLVVPGTEEFNSGTKPDSSRWWFSFNNCMGPSYRVFKDYLNNNAIDTLTNEDIWPYINRYANDTIKNGSLTITSKKEHLTNCKVWDRWPVSSFCYGAPQNPPIPCPVDSFVDFEYSTGLLISQTPYKYGYYEMRMRMPDPSSTYANKGLGPNFWFYMRNDTTIWSEIDVFEFAGYSNLYSTGNYHTSAVHLQKYTGEDFGTHTTNPADTLHYAEGLNLGQITFSGGYHIFGINWLPEKIDFYYDGTLFKTTNRSEIFPNKLTEMRLLIELNHPTTNFATLVDTVNTVFPFNYDIDYLRIWQYKQNCDSILNQLHFNTATFDPAVYQRISVGGSGGSANIVSGKNISFRANEHVLLDEGFEVQSGGEFLADINDCYDYANPNNRTAPPTIDPFDSPYFNEARILNKN